jgi:hypothetical protein
MSKTMSRLLTRRRLLSLAPPLLAGPGLLGARALAAPAAGERCFVFLFCKGGWDTTYAFTPAADTPGVEGDPDGVAAEAGGIRFVDSEARPSVRAFFETHGPRTCLINGLEVRSITHDRCTRFLMTGRADDASDDWPTLIAASSAETLLLPHLAMSGPVFLSEHAASVVRMGPGGQLPALLSGEALSSSDLSVSALEDELEALVSAHLQDRAAALEAGGEGRTARFARGYGQALRDVEALGAYADKLALGADMDQALCGQDTLAEIDTLLESFSLGLSRCGIVQYAGVCAGTFDTHSVNSQQSEHLEELFGVLDYLMAGVSARGLEERVTAVVVSEMGREPLLNADGGKGHWTFTSALLVGAGVRGGQVVGGMDGDFFGQKIDLASGEATDGGERLTSSHLGATLLALADVDPGPYVDEGVAPITAALRG